MSAREWYTARQSMWVAVRDDEAARAVTISRLRLVTFFVGVALAWFAASGHRLSFGVASAAAFAAFAALVGVHARRLERVAHAERSRAVSACGVARLDRDWAALPPAPVMNLSAHPYAEDLDLAGHASLLRWLGPTATAEGTRVLQAWLLAPCEATAVASRQAAVSELAVDPEWREQLLARGAGCAIGDADLERFLSWAETRAPLFRGWFQALVLALTVATLGLLGAYVFGWMASAWWIGPMVAGIVLSFTAAPRMYDVFDRVSIGEGALVQYAAMLDLALQREWQTPMLASIQAAIRRGGDAPAVVRQLARLSQWSHARRAAALLHFPLQALTLWDFHILFALERWRSRAGGHVRGWLAALGELDAIAVLSAIRHDEPDWCDPNVDAGAAQLTATGLGHPLIAASRRVPNDVAVGPAGSLLLVTGSNMSGKSTLLRAIGINVVLAQAGAPVCASGFTLPPLAVHTSIRIQDSLEQGLSYFMAALARLKSIVDAAEHGRADGRVVFYLLDEVLQGTNSAERATAVRAIARHLLDARAIGVMTTHDLSIAEEEPFRSHAHLVHFSEQVHADGSMTFDYTLREGLATSRNALRLMQLIGIDPR